MMNRNGLLREVDSMETTLEKRLSIVKMISLFLFDKFMALNKKILTAEKTLKMKFLMFHWNLIFKFFFYHVKNNYFSVC